MKRVLATACFASLMASTTVFALTYSGTNKAGEGVVLSKHNMLRYAELAGTDSEGRVCAFCHTPHHAVGGEAGDYLPLWSHTLLNQSQRTYSPYNTETFKVEANMALAGATLLCMSCHDGVIAVDQHYGAAPVGAMLTNDEFKSTETKGGGSGIGANQSLVNDHPVGFNYKTVQEARPFDLNAMTTDWPGTSTGKKIKDGLGANYLFTCASCHDVHNKDSVGNDYSKTTRNFFLYGNNNGSQFCLTCHNK